MGEDICHSLVGTWITGAILVGEAGGGRVGCYLILPRQGFNASDLSADFVPASGGPHVDLSVVFQALRDRQTQLFTNAEH